MSDKANVDNTSAIDKALAAAKARKAMKSGAHPLNSPATPFAPTKAKAAKPAKEPKEPKRPKVTEEEKAAKKAARDAERAEKKAVRDAARDEKRAAREAARKPAHMSKVAKAAEKLPALSDAAQLAFNEATANLGAAEIAALSAHLTHFNRASATERALDRKLQEGDLVRIVSGENSATRYIGREGTVVKAQRIRCYVELEGVAKPVYLFTSDVEVLESAETEEVADEAASA